MVCGIFSADGTHFLTGSQDHTARLWDSATLKPIGPSIKHDHDVWFVGFSPDGKSFWTSTEKGAVRLFNMPQPVTGDAERLVLWIQVLSGSKLHGMQLHELPVAELLKSQQRLEQLGGPP